MINSISISLLILVLIWSIEAKDNAILRLSKISCNNDTMKVNLFIDQNKVKRIYLKHMKDFPDVNCQPNFVANEPEVSFHFVLKNNYNKCGLVRIYNQKTGVVTYRHEIQIEDENNQKKMFPIKCILKPDKQNKGHSLTKRDFPFAISEDEEIEIISNITKYAPEPIINATVRQDGKIIQNELKVAPGTPLQMEIFLDRDSSSIYGILVKHMSVSDTRSQDETLILNGCAIDPFLFDNFKSSDGDFLSAKFKAFKFPETPYVMFFITVNVCLDKCQGVECSDGKVGYGKRRKREIFSPSNDPNKIYEISFTSFIKMNEDNDNDNNNHNFEESTTLREKISKRLAIPLREKLIFGLHNPLDDLLTDADPKPEKLSDESVIQQQTDNRVNAAISGIQNCFIQYYFLAMIPIICLFYFN